MIAAKTNSIEAVRLLLEKKADPDTADQEGRTALTYGVLSDNIEIIKLLFSKTSAHIDVTMKTLAESTFKPDQDLRNEVKELISKRSSLLWIFLERVTRFGNEKWLGWLLPKFHQKISELSPRKLKILVENAIMSDNPKACKAIFKIFKEKLKNPSITSKLKKLALERGKRGVIKALKIKPGRNSKRGKDVYEIIVKCEEFEYKNNISIVKKKWLSSRENGGNVWIPLKVLIKGMKAPPVHYREKHAETGCPEHCTQKRICLRIRQVEKLVLDMMKRIAKKHPIFADPKLIVVGSMKEGTIIGSVVETDMTLIGNSELEGHFKFDEENQELIRCSPNEELPEKFKNFTNGTKFDTTKYFNSFIEEAFNALNSGELPLPDGLQLSTGYHACEVCRSLEDEIPQDVRCRHKPDCQDHKEKLKNQEHQETCDCKEFSNPCMSFTKIGIGLHIEFHEPDGTKINLDVDVSPPTIPVKNVENYDGSNKRKRQWLEKHRPVNWISEWRKTYDMTAATGGKRAVRLRRVNRDLVIPEQVHQK